MAYIHINSNLESVKDFW